MSSPRDISRTPKPTTTPTRTPKITATSGPRPTNTFRPTRTPTPTKTLTRTPRPTRTPRFNVTPTKTPTLTKTPTKTPTTTPSSSRSLEGVSSTPSTTPTLTPTSTTSLTSIDLSPTPTITPTSTTSLTSIDLSPTPTITPTITNTPSETQPLYGMRAGVIDSTSDTAWSLYIPVNYRLYILLDKGVSWSVQELEQIFKAVDYLSAVLKNSPATPITQSNQVPNPRLPGKWVTNPMLSSFPTIGDNDGTIVTFTKTSLPGQTIAAAGVEEVRLMPGVVSHLLPSLGTCIVNSTLNSVFAFANTPAGRPVFFNVIVHELLHVLGIGTLWDIKTTDTNNASILNRSYLVGAEDGSSNPTHGLAGNVFYTTNRGTSSRQPNQVGNELANTDTYVDITQKFALNPNMNISNESAALSAYNQCFYFNVSSVTPLSALPLENGMNSGSFGSHWFEGMATDNSDPERKGLIDARQYYGQQFPGAPALQDEIMTPIATQLDMPISKVTLGALKDLGWTVNFNMAENFEPLYHTVRYDTTDNRFFTVNKYNYLTFDNKTGFITYHVVSGGGASASYFSFEHLRKGLTYTFINETGDGWNLDILAADEITPVTNKTVTANYIRWTVPQNYPGNLAVLVSNNPAKPAARLYLSII